MKHVIGFVLFIIIWISGCALNEHYFQIDSYSWLMAYGYTVGGIGHLLKEAYLLKD